MLLLAVAAIATLVGAWWLIRFIGIDDALLAVVAYLALVPTQIAAIVLLVGGPLRTLRPGALTAACLAVATLEVTAGLARRGWPARASRRRSVKTFIAHPLVLVAGVVVLAEYLWESVRTIILPVHGWDALSYHLISPSSWVMQGRIGETGLDVYADGYPQGQELLHAFTMTYQHSLIGTGLVVVWLAVLGAACVAWIARALGASNSWAAFGGLLFLAVPTVFLQISAVYVDVGGATVALAVLVLARNRPPVGSVGSPGRVAMLALTGAVLGLAVAIKASNLVLVPIVVGMLALDGTRAEWPEGSMAPGRPRPFRDLAVLCLPLAAIGGLWYIQNLLEHGNPFYPVTMLGFTGIGDVKAIIGGNKPPELESVPLGPIGELGRSWIEDLQPHALDYDQRLGGFGPLWLLAGLPALVAVVWRCWRTHQPVLLGIGVPAVVLSLASSTGWWARFSFPLAALGCSAVAWVLHEVRARRTWQHLAVVWVVGLSLAGMAMANFPTDVAGPEGRVASPADLWRLSRHAEERDAVYPWGFYADMERVPAGAPIAVMGEGAEQFPQMLVGMNLEHLVIPLDDPATEAELVEQLEAADARFVVVPASKASGDLGSAVAARRTRFRPVITPIGTADATLYELGHFTPCDAPRIELDLVGAGRRRSLDGQLVARCGDLTGQEVLVWASTSEEVWPSAKRLGVVETDRKGRFVLALEAGDQGREVRYFASFSGGDIDGRYLDPAASAVLEP